MHKSARNDPGISTIGAFVLIAIVAMLIFILVQYVGSAQHSGRFHAAVKQIALEGIRKSSEDIREEVLDRADELGIVVGREDVIVSWGPARQYLDIEVFYSVPVDLEVCRFEREFAFSHRRELSGAKKLMDQVERRVKGSYDTMLDRVQEATESK